MSQCRNQLKQTYNHNIHKHIGYQMCNPQYTKKGIVLPLGAIPVWGNTIIYLNYICNRGNVCKLCITCKNKFIIFVTTVNIENDCDDLILLEFSQ